MELQIKGNKIFAPLKDAWLVNKPEEEVRQRYICRLVDNYQYNLDQMTQEIKVNNSQRGTGAARADIVVWRSQEDKDAQKSPIIVVECKAENVTIREADYFQGYNYAAWAGADFFVTTNLKETRIFQVVKGEMPKRLQEIVDIPDAATANSDKKIKELLKKTKAFTRDEFSKLLFKCHNIIRNNDKLSPEAAFDEISKILFIKIRYERENSANQIFSLETFKRDKESYNSYKPQGGEDFYQFLFEQTKQQFEKDHLFEPNERINIRENSFESIVKELEIYNLSTTSDDVKGIAFEEFLGKTFRGELGQFFTPRTIVDFMVSILDPQEGELICDPCCGSGGFLIRAFEYVREHIESDIESEKENIKRHFYTDAYNKMSKAQQAKVDAKVSDAFNKINHELDMGNEDGRLRRLSFDCIYGTDANPRMARTAKMNMIMHGDGHGGVHHHDGLLNVNGIWENRFDVIFTNPPFGSRIEKGMKITEADRFTDVVKIEAYKQRYGKEYEEALRQVNDNVGKTILSLFDTGIMSGLTEVLFVERCIRLLRPGGRLGIVLPEGVLNNTKLQKVREYFESRAKILLIVSIPQDVFIASGATVKPSLLFFRKFTEEEQLQYDTVKTDAQNEAMAQYQTEIDELNQGLSLRGKKAMSKEDKKKIKERLKEIENLIREYSLRTIKERCDYEIPVAEVEKAGISTTGQPIENELIPLAAEFLKYRQENEMWSNIIKKMAYTISDDGTLSRTYVIG
ncbi:MAG: N-6 DNA methylase [Bacteroidales bacterium]|nr:N-6 DNA methylase [Bacteroidales bacterium]